MSEVRFCMMAQINLVSFAVKLETSLFGVDGVLLSSMAIAMVGRACLRADG